MVDIASDLANFGADLAALHALDEEGPDLLPYATIVKTGRAADNVLSAVKAVYEWPGAR